MGRLQWGAIGIVALLIVVMAPSDNDGGKGSGVRTENRPSGGSTSSADGDAQRAHQAGHVELYRLATLESRDKNRNNVGDAFNTHTWYEPPPSHALPSELIPPPPPPVVVPTAPPLPFTYLGRYGDTPTRTVILSKGERVYTVTVGDVIENSYRVEKFTPGMINLLYLPLGIEQHLATGETL